MLPFTLVAVSCASSAQVAPPKPARAELFPISSCLGKGFAEYEKHLGKPSHVDHEQGEFRTYQNAKLKKLGIKSVELGVAMDVPGHPNAVTYVVAYFVPGTPMDVTHALIYLGVAPSTFKTSVEQFAMDGQAFQKQDVSGLLVLGVKMAEIVTGGYVHFGSGYGVSFCTPVDKAGKPVATKSALLMVEYQ